MQTIRLRINDRIYKNILWLLGKFDKEELQVIEENGKYSSTKAYLTKELEKLDRGDEELLDIEELDAELENVVREYEA